MLLNILRRNVKDERVIQWIKRYLKSGVMENGVVMETEEGSPQGGNISPPVSYTHLESKAEDIIRYRETYGPFERIEDIMNISGIKDAAFQKIKDSITV